MNHFHTRSFLTTNHGLCLTYLKTLYKQKGDSVHGFYSPQICIKLIVLLNHQSNKENDLGKFIYGSMNL